MNKLKKILASVIAAALVVPGISAAAERHDTVILGGTPFGLTMYTSGVVVINVDDKDDSPAHAAGIQKNDVITRANGEEISTNEQLKEIIADSKGEDIELSLTRGESPISLTITPEQTEDGGYSVGMWIRDSTAGLGTVTYYDEGAYCFGALGHGINDKDTGILLPLKRGKVLQATITSVSKAQQGVPGGLNGYITDVEIGEITLNTGFGVFGRYDSAPEGKRIECADSSEVSIGDAYIYCTLDDGAPQSYDVRIERLNEDDSSGQNMIIRVTDSELLDKTGGIIQGMSGSPIIQNGKLVGAVTHVFVNSPEMGYGILIENMRECYKEYGGL